MDQTSTPTSQTTPPPDPTAPSLSRPPQPLVPANAQESKKSMYLIGGIIILLVICLLLSFLILSQIITI